MISKQNPGAVPAALRTNGLSVAPAPRVAVVEEHDRETGVIRLAVVKVAA